jgi:hypothetical protein
MRIVRWCLAVVFIGAAGFALIAYMSQGIAIGDVIGVPGRESDIAAMQRYAQSWLIVFALSEMAASAAVASLMTFGGEATRGARFVARGLVGIIVAGVATAGVVAGVFAVAGWARR